MQNILKTKMPSDIIDLKVKGTYPEIEIKDIHYCGVDSCPVEGFQILVSFGVTVSNDKLGETVAKIKKAGFDSSIIWNDEDEWEITVKKV